MCVWADDGIASPDALDAALVAPLGSAAPIIDVAIDWSCTTALIEAAGEVVAWR